MKRIRKTILRGRLAASGIEREIRRHIPPHFVKIRNIDPGQLSTGIRPQIVSGERVEDALKRLGEVLHVEEALVVLARHIRVEGHPPPFGGIYQHVLAFRITAEIGGL